MGCVSVMLVEVYMLFEIGKARATYIRLGRHSLLQTEPFFGASHIVALGVTNTHH